MKKLLLLTIIIILSLALRGQEESNSPSELKKQSVYIDPVLPFFDLVIINYGYKFNKKNELVTGLIWSRAESTSTKYLEYPGNITSVGAIAGYRRYFFKGFHADYWLMPAYNSFYEKNENQHYKSFSVYNELRIGYNFEFELLAIPILINAQWPVGFSLFDTNKPESFKKIDQKDPVFYLFFPNVWFGFRF